MPQAWTGYAQITDPFTYALVTSLLMLRMLVRIFLPLKFWIAQRQRLPQPANMLNVTPRMQRRPLSPAFGVTTPGISTGTRRHIAATATVCVGPLTTPLALGIITTTWVTRLRTHLPRLATFVMVLTPRIIGSLLRIMPGGIVHACRQPTPRRNLAFGRLLMGAATMMQRVVRIGLSLSPRRRQATLALSPFSARRRSPPYVRLAST
jgi:hypothetical protein